MSTATTRNIGTAKNPLWHVKIQGDKGAVLNEEAARPTVLTDGAAQDEPRGGFGGVDESADPVSLEVDPKTGKTYGQLAKEDAAEELSSWQEDLGDPKLTLDEMDHAGTNEVPTAWTKKLVEIYRSEGPDAADEAFDRMTSPESEEAMYAELERERQQYDETRKGDDENRMGSQRYDPQRNLRPSRTGPEGDLAL
jgi:hypothetical protein